MAENSNEISFQEIIFKGKAFIFYLRTKWLNLLFATIIGGGLGILYYYIQTPKYEAECTFVLDEKSGGGGLASLASNFGVDVGSMMGGSSSLFANDNLLEILQSRRIIETALLTEVDTAKISHQTLADLYLDFTKLKNGLINNPRTKEIHFYGYANRDQFTLLQDSVLNIVYKNFIKNNFLSDRTNKKTQIFKVSVTSANEKFSKLMSERIVAEAKNLYINIKTGTTQRNMERLQGKADSILALLNSKTYESAESQILNVNPGLKTLTLPAKVANRNEMLYGSLYTEIVKNLESTKTALMLQTPVIQIIDSPKYPLLLQKRGLKFLIFISSIFFITVMFIFYTFKFLIINRELK